MYSITAVRITSGDELKYRNGLAGQAGRGILPTYHHTPNDRCIWFDSTPACVAHPERKSGVGDPGFHLIDSPADPKTSGARGKLGVIDATLVAKRHDWLAACFLHDRDKSLDMIAQ